MHVPASKIKYKISNKFTSLLDLIYPIGAFYISAEKTSPAELFGGEWIAITNGVALRASNTFGETGSDTHTLTTSEMPKHSHTISGTAQSAGDHNHQPGNDSASRPVGFAGFYNESSTNLTLISGKVTSTSSGTFQALGWNNTTFPKGHAYGNHATNTKGAHTHSLSASASEVGGGGAHSIVQKSLNCYV